jgi:hypothetical protein
MATERPYLPIILTAAWPVGPALFRAGGLVAPWASSNFEISRARPSFQFDAIVMLPESPRKACLSAIFRGSRGGTTYERKRSSRLLPPVRALLPRTVAFDLAIGPVENSIAGADIRSIET